MALWGIESARPTRWLRENKAVLPSLITLVGLSIFWTVGAVGGVHFLADADSPVMILTGLYMMLAAVAVSVIIATLALTDFSRRLRWHRDSR